MNNQVGAAVEFKGMKADFEALAKMTIFTNLMTRRHGNTDVQLLNISHIHFNSTNEEVSIDAVYMESGETLNDHMEFKVDASGVPLRYKILI